MSNNGKNDLLLECRGIDKNYNGPQVLDGVSVARWFSLSAMRTSSRVHTRSTEPVAVRWMLLRLSGS